MDNVNNGSIKATVVCRHNLIWEGEVVQATIPASDGSLGILPGRQPLLATTVRGKVNLTFKDNTQESVDVAEGFAFFDENHLTVVVSGEL